MLARMRPSFLLSCLLVLAALSPVQAQIHGTPPSVTSLGFGGSNNPAPGVPASVTSLGPNGFGNGFNGFGNGFNGFGNGFNGFGNGFRDCCFGPSFSNHSPLFGERRVRDHHRFRIGESTPLYVPYAVPYAVPYPVAEADPDDGGPVDDPSYARGGPPVDDRGPRHREDAAFRQAPREPAPKATAATDPTDPPEEPVASQPTTVLIFKDGHKSEVQNYAIVGGTLFDFSDGRSHKILLADLDLPATLKANDDRGVDFRIPAKAKQVSKKN
jgi:hypothetical protein